MKRQQPSTSGSVAPKRAAVPSTSTAVEPPLQQGRIYFTPIGGITVPLQESEGSLSLTDILSICRPIRSCHFSFMIEADYLINCYPESLRSKPITLVVGAGPDATDLRREVGAHKNVEVISANLPIAFGTHHSKLSILEGEDGKVHVIVSTANMISDDWEFKTQQFWYGYGQKKEKIEEVSISDFQNDLVDYLGYYNQAMNPWRELIKLTDFSAVQDRLVFSVPGYHKKGVMERIGHLKLRNILKERFPFDPNFVHEERTSFISQCSSLGSLGPTPISWFRGEFLKSLEGADQPPKNKPARMLLVFPCVEDIRKSCQGYAGGGSVPYQNSTHQKQKWLDNVLCKWRADKKRRTKAIPHCKTYVKAYKKEPQWQLLTSANLSKAAWGVFQKNGEQLMIRSYEIGVLVTDPARFNIPFDYPCVQYNEGDEPFTIDTEHEEPDSLGNAMQGQTPRHF